MRRTLLALAASAVFAWSGAAAGRSARLAWRGPADCASSEALHAAVERLLGEPITDGDAFQADADVAPNADGSFTLTLTIRTPEGTGVRTVRAAQCESLLSVAAFSIALALNPELQAKAPSVALEAEAVPATPEPAREAATQPPVAVKTPGVAAPPPAARGTPRSPAANPELWLTGHALVDTSLLPSPAPGFEALGEVLLRERIRLGLGGAAFVAQTKESAAGGGHFSLWSLEAHACAQAGGPVVLGLCPAFHLARVRGEGRGVTPPLEQRTWAPAPGVTVFALYELSPRMAASLRATALFPTNRNVFVIHAGPVHQIPAFSAELALGLAVRAF